MACIPNDLSTILVSSEEGTYICSVCFLDGYETVLFVLWRRFVCVVCWSLITYHNIVYLLSFTKYSIFFCFPPLLLFTGDVRKVSRIGESPVPSSYHRAEHTLEISASDTQTNANSAGINGTNPKKKGLGTKYFSAVSCLSVRDGEVSGGNNNIMNSAEGEFCCNLHVVLRFWTVLMLKMTIIRCTFSGSLISFSLLI